jgi:hypothetical protein
LKKVKISGHGRLRPAVCCAANVAMVSLVAIVIPGHARRKSTAAIAAATATRRDVRLVLLCQFVALGRRGAVDSCKQTPEHTFPVGKREIVEIHLCSVNDTGIAPRGGIVVDLLRNLSLDVLDAVRVCVCVCV